MSVFTSNLSAMILRSFARHLLWLSEIIAPRFMMLVNISFSAGVNVSKKAAMCGSTAFAVAGVSSETSIGSSDESSVVEWTSVDLSEKVSVASECTSADASEKASVASEYTSVDASEKASVASKLHKDKKPRFTSSKLIIRSSEQILDANINSGART